MITSKTKNSISVFIFYSIPLDTIFWKLSTDFSFLFSTISCSGKQKSSRISPRADCHSGGGDNGAMILDSWDDCFEVLKYVKNSKYEGFFDENEAFEFLSTVKYEF